jgi:hypothetical protein
MVLPAGILFCREGTQGFWIRKRFEYPAEHPRTHSGTQCLNTVRLPVKSTPLNLKPFLDQKITHHFQSAFGLWINVDQHDIGNYNIL